MVAVKVTASPPLTMSAQETVTKGHSHERRDAATLKCGVAASDEREIARTRRLIFRMTARELSSVAAVAAELRAGRERVVAVLAGLRLKRLAAVVAELRA